jgi:hypothetical protein
MGLKIIKIILLLSLLICSTVSCSIKTWWNTSEIDMPTENKLKVLKLDNTERYLQVTKDVNSNKIFSCLEPVGPATRLNELTSELKVDKGDLTVAQQIRYAEKLGEIYKIAEAAQLSNIVLQRLCEARMNGIIDDEEYKDYYSDFMSTIQCALGQKYHCKEQAAIQPTNASKKVKK